MVCFVRFLREAGNVPTTLDVLEQTHALEERPRATASQPGAFLARDPRSFLTCDPCPFLARDPCTLLTCDSCPFLARDPCTLLASDLRTRGSSTYGDYSRKFVE